MASKPDVKSRFTPSGEYYVILQRDNVKLFVSYQNVRQKFVFLTTYTFSTRYIKSEAELIVAALAKMGELEQLRLDNVYMREISYRKKKRPESRRAERIFPTGTTDINAYFYYAPTTFKEVKTMDNNNSLVKLNNPPKMVKPKAGSVIVEKGAIRKTVNNGVPAESPKQVFEFIVKPYALIKSMPLYYVYNQVIRYFNSLVAEVQNENGKTIDYKWVGIPERRGLALALGCSVIALENYVADYERRYLDNDDDINDSSIDEMPMDIKAELAQMISGAEPKPLSDADILLADNMYAVDNNNANNTDNAGIQCTSEQDTANDFAQDVNQNSPSTLSKNSYSVNIIHNMAKNNISTITNNGNAPLPNGNHQPITENPNSITHNIGNMAKNRKRLVYTLIKRSLAYIEYYKVKCLYGSSPVGAMFDLKCQYGWVEKQSLTIEAGQSLLGRQRSAEEIAQMAAAVGSSGGGGRLAGVGFDLSGVED